MNYRPHSQSLLPLPGCLLMTIIIQSAALSPKPDLLASVHSSPAAHIKLVMKLIIGLLLVRHLVTTVIINCPLGMASLWSVQVQCLV